MRINQFSEGIELGDDDADKPAWFIVSEDGQIASGPYNSEREARSDTARLRWFTPSQYFIDYGIRDIDDRFVDIETGYMGEDVDQIPKPGDAIRTTKLEGKVSKVEDGYVYFTTPDGRNMRNTIENCLVVEKLADQEDEIFEDEEIDEVSTELLAKYKIAAGKSASGADKKGDLATGNKRFSGIVKATKKQFDNDAKKSVSEEYDHAGFIKQTINDIHPEAMSIEKLKDRVGRETGYINHPDFDNLFSKAYNDFYGIQGDNDDDNFDYTDYTMRQGENGRLGYAEGTMGGINRSAPSNDVSYEHVLDEVKAMWEKAQLNELSIEKLKAYKDAATSVNVANHAPLRKVAKHMQGAGIANQKIKTKTGARVVTHYPDRGAYESRLAEFVELDEVDMSQFADILAKQHQEIKPDKKLDIKKAPSKNENFVIWYRPQADNLKPVTWQVRNKTNSDQPESIRYTGKSSNETDAFNDAEDWIVKSSGGTEASKNITVNFNAAFAREIAPEGETLWINFWEGPILVYSKEPQAGYKKTVIRTQEHARTDGAALLPVTTMSPSAANKIGLRGDSRYTLGPREELKPEVYGCTLEWHSRVEKGISVPLKEPSITTSHPEKKKK